MELPPTVRTTEKSNSRRNLFVSLARDPIFRVITEPGSNNSYILGPVGGRFPVYGRTGFKEFSCDLEGSVLCEVEKDYFFTKIQK